MNYKNIIYQFLAGLFLVIGIKQFFIFVHFDLIELIYTMGKENFTFLAEKSNQLGISNQLQELNNAKIILGFVGIIINYIILAIIAYKHKQSGNIAIAITCVLVVLHFFKLIDLSPLSFIKINLVAAFLLPAFFALILSTLFYYLSFKTSRN